MRESIRSIFNRFESDKIIISLSLLYIIIPICIFFIGWLKIPFALFLCTLFIFFAYRIFQNICSSSISLINKSTGSYWIITGSVCFFWVYLSGIGGFCYQNSDYWARNPIYRDLSTYSWPVVYNLSVESDVVQRITGSGNVGFVYYFTWWLPASGLSKLFHLGELIRSFLLFGWAFIGILLIIYCINRHVGKCTYVTTVILIIFSGLDAVMYFLINGSFSLTEHIEWWAGYFQYSSNTTLLFFVFNQSIPVWLIVCILLQLKDNKYIAAVSSLVFPYSPWAVFGMIPIAVTGTFKHKNLLKKPSFLNVLNIMIPLALLLIYGSFYLSGSGSTGALGFQLLKVENVRKFFCNYIVFVFLEAGVYFCVMGSQEYQYYLTTLFELLLIPLVSSRDGNFCMRASIPALFLLMTFVIRFFGTQPKDKITKRFLALIMICIIGAITTFTEINRSLTATLTLNDDQLHREQVYSFGNIQTDEEKLIGETKNQFFVYGFENTFFFKYLAKTIS